MTQYLSGTFEIFGKDISEIHNLTRSMLLQLGVNRRELVDVTTEVTPFLSSASGETKSWRASVAWRAKSQQFQDYPQ